MKRILSFTSGISEPLCEFLQHRIERCFEGHNSQLTTNFCAYMYARRYLYIFHIFKHSKIDPGHQIRIPEESTFWKLGAT